jgi:non-specific serine/threonine protein kinase
MSSVTELASRYELVRTLGSGGMGVVHEALDRRLGRHVANKLIRNAADDASARERFLREARAAAGISHPNVCLLHEVGEHEGQPFLVMELLEGEPLSDRLTRGAFTLSSALETMLPVLSALGALHARGLVHRDLKPSNIFLTPHGVKLLDFGLAREVTAGSAEASTVLTLPGTLSGTPHYMAPEQITGDALDARTDIFAAGIVLYELVTGRRPFSGTSTLEVLNSILTREPPPIGRPELATLEPILRRSLQRWPQDRYASAEALAADLRPLVRAVNADVAAAPIDAPAARVVVLPFRLLRADEEVAFLEGALPDAITASLATIPSLSVRSNVAALKFGSTVDLARVATELDVDHVITGTLLRSGDQIRITSQLIEAPLGRVRWSQTIQRHLGDLFELQDAISSRIVQSLPLDAAPSSQDTKEIPATPRAYELYLRANERAMIGGQWLAARDLYEACVAEDPQFAPAWARLGRVHRVIGKYLDADYRASFEKAEAAFQRAFALNPDLSLTHHLYVYLEVETGRATGALTRIVNRLHREPNQAELYAALCQAARYCGLLDASVAAHTRARTLDPQIQTSVGNTYLALQDYPRMLEATRGISSSLEAVALFEVGARPEELQASLDAEFGGFQEGSSPALFGEALRCTFAGDHEGVRRVCERLMALSDRYPDGEAIYTVTRLLARAGCRDLALQGFREAAAAGFFPAVFFERDPWIDALRDDDSYRAVLAQARERSVAADAAFEAAGGYRLLGIQPASSGASHRMR